MSVSTQVGAVAKNATQARVICDVLWERDRQDVKWGEQNHSHLKWLAILSEEQGEVAKEILEDSGEEKLRAELVQVAAVALAFIECLDRARVPANPFSVGDRVFSRHNPDLTGQVTWTLGDVVRVQWDDRCFTTGPRSTPLVCEYLVKSIGKMSDLPAICNPNAQTCCSEPRLRHE